MGRYILACALASAVPALMLGRVYKAASRFLSRVLSTKAGGKQGGEAGQQIEAGNLEEGQQTTYFPWSLLPDDEKVLIAQALPHNVAVCTLRLLNKETAATLGRKFININMVNLTEPVPHHAFAWYLSSGFDKDTDLVSPAMLKLTREQRVELLCRLASQGSVENLKIAAIHAGFPVTRSNYAEVAKAAVVADKWEVVELLREWRCLTAADDQTVEWAASAGLTGMCFKLLNVGYMVSYGAVCAAFRGGHVLLGEQLLAELQQSRFWPTADELVVAAMECDMPMFRRLHRLWVKGLGKAAAVWEARQDRKLLAAAAGSPTPDWKRKVKWLEKGQHRKTAAVFESAARQPDVQERMAWLQERGYPAMDLLAVLGAAAEAGNAVGMRFLVTLPGWHALSDTDKASVADVAAERGQLDVLQVLLDPENLIGGNLIDGEVDYIVQFICAAAKNGHLPVVQWLVEAHKDGIADQSAYVDSAAESGSFALLEWLARKRCPVQDSALTSAVKAGSLAGINWFNDRGYPKPTDGMPYRDAMNRDETDLVVLGALQHTGIPWGKLNTDGDDLITVAIRKTANLEVRFRLRLLSWMLANGCPVDWRRAEKKAEGGDEDVYSWVQEQRAAAVQQALAAQ